MLATVLDRFEHGHHVFRAYWKNAFLRQYEKFACFLRNELCSNNLRDFGLKKGLDHLPAVRARFQTITDRFASFQAVLTTFQLSPKTCDLNQLRYDLRKRKGHGLLQRDGNRYAYRLTPRGGSSGTPVSVFPQTSLRCAGQQPLPHAPDPTRQPSSRLEQAYYKADKAIQNIVDLLATA